MRKKILRNLAIINCLLLTLPGWALAAENDAESTDPNAIEEVIVTAVPLDKYLVTTSVITAKEIEEKGAQNLSGVLEDVPGVRLHRGKKGTNFVDIRGSSVSYTKIYIDGVLVNPLASCGGEVDMDLFPVDNIAKIEVIKGPAPVSYGTDAIGGMIIITTKNGVAYKGGKVSLSGGSDDTRNVSVAYGDGDERFNYFFNAGTQHTDGWINGTDRESNYFNAKLKWKVKDTATLTFTGGYSLTDKGCMNKIDPYTGKVISSTSGFWTGLNNWQYRDWEKTDLSLRYAEQVNKKFDYNVTIYRFTEDQGIWADGRRYDPWVVGKNGIAIDNGILGAWKKGKWYPSYSIERWNASLWESTLEGMDLQGNLKLDAKNTLTFGSMYNNIKWQSAEYPHDPDNPNWSKYKNKKTGYYLQDNFVPNEKTTITYGLRYDKNKVQDINNKGQKSVSDVNPAINVVYQLNDDDTLRASYGKTISFPTVSQLYGTTNGNSALVPEKATNYELGLKHRIDDSASVDIAIFKNSISNLIEKSSTGDKRYINVNNAEINGIEVDYDKAFTNQCNGFISYTYMDTEQTKEDGTIQRRRNVPYHDLSYGLTYSADKGYKFSLTGHLVSDRSTGDDSWKVNDDSRSVPGAVPTIPSYHLMDFQIKRQMSDTQEWYINVFNIFDKHYESELFYPAAGRTFVAGMNFKF